MRERLEALPPAARAELLHDLRLPDPDRAEQLEECLEPPDWPSKPSPFPFVCERVPGGSWLDPTRPAMHLRPGPPRPPVHNVCPLRTNPTVHTAPSARQKIANGISVRVSKYCIRNRTAR